MLQFMKNKILFPILVLSALAAFFSFKYSEDENTTASEQKKKMVLETVTRAINQGHFAPRPIDDSFSYKVYNKVLTTLDYEKKFFTQRDIDQLKKYQFAIDDELKSSSLEFYNDMSNIFTKRVNDAEGYYKDILNTPFNFNTDESIVLNADKIDYASDDNALKDRWRKLLKYRVLAKYVDLKKDQEKKRDSLHAKLKTDAELEAEARTSVRKNQDNYFKRLHKITDDERFSLYVNSITGTEDPHTDYFPPKDKQQFDEMMSGTFSGIGASLKNDDGKITVATIIAGSPCWKQGQLKAGDEIIKVAQGAEEPVDIQGFETEDAVKLIRGKKGTEVRLTVKKVNGAVQVIPIIRGEVSIEETFAKSAIIDTKNGTVGYIYLPEFYSDFQHAGGRRCAEDVAIEVMKLKNAGVKGIILDLRYNTGGSLSDVVDMSGLFVDQGPIVQVKASNAAPMALNDNQPGLLYDGPLAIMVNQNSASASEIMAAALQDYKRAVIVGTTTYGKGTVQQVRSLDEFVNWTDRLAANNKGEALAPGTLGSIKLTIQKFYRVNGGSTQLRGVTPDIKFPDPLEYVDQGERRDKAALKWDEIPAANYTPVRNAVNVSTLAELSKKRMAANQTFDLIEQNAVRVKKQEEDNTYSLNETAYRKEMDEVNATAKKMEDLEKKITPLAFSNPKEDMQRINIDSTSIKKNEEWIKNLKKDIFISETVNIINDMSRMNMKVSMSEKR
jgi:carboxyl-terminal processing protease